MPETIIYLISFVDVADMEAWEGLDPAASLQIIQMHLELEGLDVDVLPPLTRERFWQLFIEYGLN